MRKFSFIVVFFAAIALSFSSFAADKKAGKTAEVKESSVNVEFRNGLLSISARKAPLGGLISEIEKKSGLKITLPKTLASKQVTVEFKDLDVLKAITSISNSAGLGGYGVSYKSGQFRSNGGKRAVDKVILVEKGGQDPSPDKGYAAFTAKGVLKPIWKEPFFDRRLDKYVDVVKGEAMVRFSPGATKEVVEKFNSDNKSKTIESYEKIGVYRLKISKDESVQEFVQKYSAGKDAYIEPVYIAGRMAASVNDPSFSRQWALPRIEADKAWEQVGEGSVITVAVIDTGVDASHPDLKNQIGKGIDAINGGENTQDENGHGTFMAGIIAAEANNSLGIAGAAWKSRIMPVKALDANGEGAYSDLIEAIVVAVDNGARVINMSLGGYSYSQFLADAVQYAHDAGAVLIAAGGNENSSLKLYPAAYPNVIGVSSTDSSDILWPSNNYGSYIRLSAPGVGVLSTTKGGSYGEATGTSASAAYASAVAALILSKNPDLSNTQVESMLFESADDLGAAGRDEYFGYGRVNALKAMEKASIEVHDVAVTGIRVEPETFKAGEATRIIVTVKNEGTFKESGLLVSAYVNEELIGEIKLSTELNPEVETEVGFDWIPSVQVEQELKIKGVVAQVIDELDIVDNNKSKELDLTESGGVVRIKYSTPVHQWITRQAVAYLDGKIDNSIYKEINLYVDYLSMGAKAEDKSTVFITGFEDYHLCGLIGSIADYPEGGIFFEDVPFRWLRHFYRPLDSQGYYLKSAEAALIDLVDCSSKEDIYLFNYTDGGEFFTNSVLWGYSHPDNSYNFKKAISGYSENNKVDAYYALGHVLHLIEDASLPEHTHLEMHGTDYQDNYEFYLKGLVKEEGADLTAVPGIKDALNNTIIVNFDTVPADSGIRFVAFIRELAKRSYTLNRYYADLSDTTKIGVIFPRNFGHTVKLLLPARRQRASDIPMPSVS